MIPVLGLVPLRYADPITASNYARNDLLRALTITSLPLWEVLRSRDQSSIPCLLSRNCDQLLNFYRWLLEVTVLVISTFEDRTFGGPRAK